MTVSWALPAVVEALGGAAEGVSGQAPGARIGSRLSLRLEHLQRGSVRDPWLHCCHPTPSSQEGEGRWAGVPEGGTDRVHGVVRRRGEGQRGLTAPLSEAPLGSVTWKSEPPTFQAQRSEEAPGGQPARAPMCIEERHCGCDFCCLLGRPQGPGGFSHVYFHFVISPSVSVANFAANTASPWPVAPPRPGCGQGLRLQHLPGRVCLRWLSRLKAARGADRGDCSGPDSRLGPPAQ